MGKKNSTKMPLMKREWKIVEHKLWYFIASAAVIILGLILTFTVGPKIGIDFQSGFAIQVEYETGILTNENQVDKKNEISKLLSDMKSSDGTDYVIRVSDVRYQGDNGKRTIRLICQSKYLTGIAEDETAYQTATDDIQNQLRTHLVDENNPYMINVMFSGQTTPTISSEMQLMALAAILASVVAMLLYVMFRFELASGVAAIVALIHDIAIMFCFMVFCQIEISSTFIAAIVAILGYSINNTLVVFDRVRENLHNNTEKNRSVATIVNKSLKETFGRSVNTTVTTLFAMVMLAVLGVSSIQIFAFPIIIGIIVGAYSSFCIAPSIYVMWKNAEIKHDKKKAKTRLSEHSSSKKKKVTDK